MTDLPLHTVHTYELTPTARDGIRAFLDTAFEEASATTTGTTPWAASTPTHATAAGSSRTAASSSVG